MADIKLDGLNEQERKYVIDILNEYAATGKSDLYESIIKDDWKEVPVDIETFLTDDRYLGKAWKSPSGESKIYPFWMEQLKKLFPDNISTSVNNFIESGARGLGKSEIATGAAGAYLMYRVMCLKDPLEYFGLKPTEKVCFAFMNITKTLAEEIAVDKFQKTIQLSPWFMSRGRMTTLNNSPYWIPPDPIAVIIGSQPSHVIGQPIYYCLDGATEIYTDTGVHRIEDLVDKTIRVQSVDESGSTQMSDLCTVEPTATSLDEYQIELEDGSVIKCTPNHRFMLKDGTYKEAQYLTLDDELYDIEDIETNIIYESITDAEKKLDIRRQSIQRSCKTDHAAGGYHWRYVNED